MLERRRNIAVKNEVVNGKMKNIFSIEHALRPVSRKRPFNAGRKAQGVERMGQRAERRGHSALRFCQVSRLAGWPVASCALRDTGCGFLGQGFSQIFTDLFLFRVYSRYRGCTKRSAIPTFFLQPLMPQFLFSEYDYGKRYIEVVKKRSAIPTFFLQPLMPQFLFSEYDYGKRY
jgi:hypothetical protein